MKALKKSVYKHIFEQSHKEYVERMVATSNMRNVEQVYLGFHSLPQLFESGIEIRLANLNSTITTPWLGGEFVEEYYREGKDYHMVLELPDDISDHIGGGFLKIELEVDTRETEGWQEYVKYTGLLPEGYTWSDEGRAFKLHMEGRSWRDAEAECQREGGHLVSVTSEKENDELTRFLQRSKDMMIIWLGGRQEAGVWSWSDSSPWGYTDWGKYVERNGHYLVMDMGMEVDEFDDFGTWTTDLDSPASSLPFVCTVARAVAKGKRKIKLKYKKDQLTFSKFHVWYKYVFTSQNLLGSWKDKRMTGFKLSWRIETERPTLMANISEVGRSIKSPELEHDFAKSPDSSSEVICKVILTVPEDTHVGKGRLV